MQTRDTARGAGPLRSRPARAGWRADLNVIDYDDLRPCTPPRCAYDLPAGGRRLVQRASGYVATLVAGQITYRDGEATGALPGRLVRERGSRPADYRWRALRAA